MVRAAPFALAVILALISLPAADAQDLNPHFRQLIADAATHDDGANFEAIIIMIARNAEGGDNSVLAAVRDLAPGREAQAAALLATAPRPAIAQDAPAPAPAPSPAPAASAPADVSLEPGWLGGWSGRVSAGLSFVSGNSDQQTYTLGLHLDRDFGGGWALTNRLSYGYAESAGVVSQDQFQLETRLERELNARWGLFLGGQYDRDQLSSYDWTAFVSAGATWQAIKTDRIDWSLRAGPGARYLTPVAGPSETQVLLDLGSSFEWTVSAASTFASQTTLLAADSSRLEQYFSFTTAVAHQWQVELGWRYKHEFEPLPGFEEADSTVTASVVREF